LVTKARDSHLSRREREGRSVNVNCSKPGGQLHKRGHVFAKSSNDVAKSEGKEGGKRWLNSKSKKALQ